MFRAVILAMLCIATPALSQETIPENGVQIAEPESSFILFRPAENFLSRLWVHERIQHFSIIILDNQDPNIDYTGMDWEERIYDPIITQDGTITSYNQGIGWMMAEGEVEGNGFFQRSIFRAGCPVIASLIVTYPRNERRLALPLFIRLSESLTIAPSPLCP